MFGRPYDVQKSSRQGSYDLIILDHEKAFRDNSSYFVVERGCF